MMRGLLTTVAFGFLTLVPLGDSVAGEEAPNAAGSYIQVHLTDLQTAVSQSVGKHAASVINTALENYFSASGTGKSASYTALDAAVNTYISEPAAKASLLKSVSAMKAGEDVNSRAVANALLRGGLNTTIDNSNKLSANEKTIAKGVVNELAGVDGSLQTASIEALQHALVKNGMSPEKAQAVGDNLSSYVSDTRNTTALKTAASIELQYVVEKNMGRKEAAVVNAAISEYLEGNRGATKEASLNAVREAVARYVSDASARETLLSAVESTRAGEKVNAGEVGNALLRGGLNSVIDANKSLSANEKTIAKGVVNQLAGIDGSLQTASIEALQHSLVKNGMSPEKAQAIGENLSSYVSDTKNTTALNTAASIELQYVVEKNMGRKEAAVVNAAISEYLEGKSGATREAALAAVQDAVNKYVSDASAKRSLLDAVNDVKVGNPVDSTSVGKALVRAGVMESIDRIPGLTPEQRDFVKREASALLEKQTTIGDVAKDAVGNGVASALEKAGVSRENARQIGQGVTDVLKDPSNTANLQQGGVNAAIDAIPGLSDDQRARAKEAAAQVLSGEKSAEEALRDNAGYAVSEALKAAGVSEGRANEIGQGVDEYVQTGKSDALEQAAVNATKDAVIAAIDSLTGLTQGQKEAAKKAAEGLLDGRKPGDVARAAIGDVVADALERTGLSGETARQIGDGITDVLGDPSATDKLVVGGINAVIEAIPGLSDAQREAVKRKVGEILAGTTTVGDAISEATQKAIADALEEIGVSPEDAEKIAGDVIGIVRDVFVGGEADWDKLGEDILDAANDVVFGENGLLAEWIDNSDLPDEAKIIAKGVIAELHGDEGALLAAGREAIVDLLVEAGLSREQAEQIAGAAGTLAETWLNGGDMESAVAALIADAQTIFCTEVGKMIDRQLEKLVAKFPILEELFKKLGVNGQKIVEFLMKLRIEDVKAAFQTILNMSWEDWSEVLGTLYEALKNWAIDKICNYINGQIDKALERLLKSAMASLSKVKGLERYMALIQFGGTMVTDLAGSEARGIINSSGATLKSLFELKGEESEQ